MSEGGLRGTQQGARASASFPVRALQFATTFDGGIVNESRSPDRRTFVTVNGSTRWNFGAGRGVTVFGDYSNGRGLGGDGRDVVSGGGSAQLRLFWGPHLNVLPAGRSISPPPPP